MGQGHAQGQGHVVVAAGEGDAAYLPAAGGDDDAGAQQQRQLPVAGRAQEADQRHRPHHLPGLHDALAPPTHGAATLRVRLDLPAGRFIGR